MPTIAQSVSPFLGLLPDQSQMPPIQAAASIYDPVPVNTLGLLAQAAQQQPPQQAMVMASPRLSAMGNLGDIPDDPFKATPNQALNGLFEGAGPKWGFMLRALALNNPEFNKPMIQIDRAGPIPDWIKDPYQRSRIAAYQAYDAAQAKKKEGA